MSSSKDFQASSAPVWIASPSTGLAHITDPSDQAEDLPLAVEMLLQCHQRVASQSRTLQRLGVYLLHQAVDPAAKEAAWSVCRYFDLAAPHHHADEEIDWMGVLRPLWQGQAQRMALIERLCADHRTLELLWLQLRPKLQRIVDSPIGTRIESLTDQIDRFTQAYEAHIRLEEQDWLTQARQTVNEEQLVQLGQQMVARRRLTS